MQVLFVHKEFPGHFGHVARYLAQRESVECTFVYNSLPARFQNRLPEGYEEWIRLIPYQSRGANRDTHFCNLHMEISLWHSQAVYQTLKARPDIKPDVVVGHSVFGTALFLRDLYPCPLVIHCEYFEQAGRPRLFSRPEYLPSEMDLLRAGRRTPPTCSPCKPARPATVPRAGSEASSRLSTSTRSRRFLTASIRSSGIAARFRAASATSRRFLPAPGSSPIAPMVWRPLAALTSS